MPHEPPPTQEDLLLECFLALATPAPGRQVANVPAGGHGGARAAPLPGPGAPVALSHPGGHTPRSVRTPRFGPCTDRPAPAPAIADAVARYDERYGRAPQPNPDRPLIGIVLYRAMGRA